MYQIFGLKLVLGFAMTCAAIFMFPLSSYVWPDSIWEWYGLATKASGIVALLFVLVGETPAFPLISKLTWRWLPFWKDKFPPLEGTWVGTTDSNWPKIAQRADLPAGYSAPKLVEIVIRCRFSAVTLKMESLDGYSSSKTKAARPVYDPEHGDLKLFYVYDNETKVPLATDSQRHYGAAFLDVKTDDNGDIYLEGNYWTNRNWEKALNTAGKIVLRRKNSRCA